MGRKLAQSLLLIAVVALLMMGGDMVQDGRREIWTKIDTGVSLASKQEVRNASQARIALLASMADESAITSKANCPKSHPQY